MYIAINFKLNFTCLVIKLCSYYTYLDIGNIILRRNFRKQITQYINRAVKKVFTIKMTLVDLKKAS